MNLYEYPIKEKTRNSVYVYCTFSDQRLRLAGSRLRALSAGGDGKQWERPGGGLQP